MYKFSLPNSRIALPSCFVLEETVEHEGSVWAQLATEDDSADALSPIDLLENAGQDWYHSATVCRSVIKTNNLLCVLRVGITQYCKLLSKLHRARIMGWKGLAAQKARRIAPGHANQLRSMANPSSAEGGQGVHR